MTTRTDTKTPGAEILAAAIAATRAVPVSVVPQRRRKLAELLESAAAQLVAEYGADPTEWPRQLFTDARRWRKKTAPTHGAGASLKFVTRDDGSTKLQHNLSAGMSEYRQAITYLSAGGAECPWATRGCKALCLVSAGQLGLSKGVRATHARSQMLRSDPIHFVVALAGDLMTTAAAYERETPEATRVFRFNGTSELALETMPSFSRILHSSGQWLLMDYAKRPDVSGWTPVQGADMVPYYVAPSASERHRNPADLPHAAVVVVDRLKDEELPAVWHGKRVIDADVHDLRLADSTEGDCVRLLRSKGKAADVVKQHRAALARGEAVITWSTFIKPIDEAAQ